MEDTSFVSVFARRPASVARGLMPGARARVAVAGVVGVAAAVPLLAGLLPADRDGSGADLAARPAAVVGRGEALEPAPGATPVPPTARPPTTAPAIALAVTAESQRGASGASGPSTPTTPAPRPSTTARPTPATPAPAPPRSPTLPPVPGSALVGVQSRLCLAGPAGEDGTALVLARCDGSRVQRWEALPDGTIRAAGLCMDAAWGSTDDYTQVQLAWCSGNPAQQWRLNGAGQLVGLQSGKCADVYSQRTVPGAPVKLWPCNGQDNQRWYWQ